jgi:hypothetical protein
LAEWKWADKSLLKPAPTTRTDHRPQRDFMSPIKFEEHCSNGVCHPLVYSDQTTEPAPHRVQPAILPGMIREKFVAYIAAHPDELALAMRQGIGPDPRLPNRKPPPPPRNAGEWVSQKMDDAETLLVSQDLQGVPHARASRHRQASRDPDLDHEGALDGQRGLCAHSAPDGEVPGVPRRCEFSRPKARTLSRI